MFDLQACSYYMLEKYEDAEKSIQKAISLNDQVVDFKITKAAILAKLGKKKEAKALLNQLTEKVKDPAIYQNLYDIGETEEQKNYSKEKLADYLKFNNDYLKWKGAVPSFLKKKEQRSDNIYRIEQEIFELSKSQLVSQSNT